MTARDRLWHQVDHGHRINGNAQIDPGDLSTLLLDYDRIHAEYVTQVLALTETRAELDQARRTRTLGGPITGRRVPTEPGAWDNVAVGGPVQIGWTGETEEP